MTALQKVLMVSNGHGEDLIGCTLLKALRKAQPDTQILTAPLVGSGHIYEKEALSVLFKNPLFPSGGFIRSAADIWGDIKAGVIGHIFSQRKQLSNYPFSPDTLFAVGDIFALWMAQAARTHRQRIVFLPTAKSNKFMPHSRLEKWLMKRWCTHIFTRDQETQEDLEAYGLPAMFCGNPMMDNLQPSETPLPIQADQPTLGLLPGSRDEAYKNLEHLQTLVTTVRKDIPNLQVLVALSPTLDTARCERIFPTDSHTLLTAAFTDVLHQSNVIVGLSGTANEQAIEVGKVVLTYPGFGPQSTPTRFKEQQQLLGKNLHFMPTQDCQALSDWIKKSLQTNPPTSKTTPPTTPAAETIIHTLRQSP